MQIKRFAVSAIAFVVVLSVVSCRPVSASAVEISAGERAQIYNYLDASQQGLINIDFQLDQDEDGNRSTRLKVYALQHIALQNMGNFYDSVDFSVAPDTFDLSVSGNCGLFRYSGDNQLHTVTVFRNSSTIATSDLFNICINANGSNVTFSPYEYDSYSYLFGFSAKYSGAAVPFVYDSSGFFTGSMHFYTWNNSITTVNCSLSPNSIPNISSGENITNYLSTSSSIYRSVGGGNSGFISMPSTPVNTSRPWTYYNDTLLPYIHDHYGDDYDDLLIFPQGYEPTAQPTTIPVEYPTIPGFDFALETNGTEPASDYNYNLPELPTKEIAVPGFDFNSINPAEVMAPITSGLSGIWSLITDVCTKFSLFPYIGIAVLCAIVAALMHLGR